MDSLFSFDAAKISCFWLLVLRLSGVFLTAPLLSQASVPVMVKSQWVVWVAFFMVPLSPAVPVIHHEGQLVILALQELAIGALLGWAVQLLLSAFQVAGELLAMQMGLNMAGMFDPVNHTQSTAMASLVSMFALLGFIGLNGHHWLLALFAHGLRYLPPGQALSFNPDGLAGVVGLVSHLCDVALHVALPVVGALILIDIAAGYLAKTMPQLNLLTLTPPIKILLGLLLISLNMPNFMSQLQTQVKLLPQLMQSSMATLHQVKSPSISTGTK
jgi:flagellar biosynthesis protein FliR